MLAAARNGHEDAPPPHIKVTKTKEFYNSQEYREVHLCDRSDVITERSSPAARTEVPEQETGLAFENEDTENDTGNAKEKKRSQVRL